MKNEFINKLVKLLIEFLGEPKNEIDSSYQLQFPCPRCIENKGEKEKNKFNLEVNIQKGLFQCWSCCSSDENMHGSIYKLIKMYGNDNILKEYKDTIYTFRESDLYKLKFNKEDFKIEKEEINDNELTLPSNYHKIKANTKNNLYALNYLFKRNIKWDIIEEFNIGITDYEENNKQLSNRIIIPSYNQYGELNYWTGRDYTNLDYRQKYFNPKIERKDIIFNEEKISWDSDITLVEGPFDHIVVPNSIPLLGKKISQDYKIYTALNSKCNANINIFLDGDAFETVKEIYSLLNHGRLYNKIRYIPVSKDLDPSEIYQKYGKKGIIEHLKKASKLSEIILS